MRRMAALSLFLATLCFALGVTEPLISIERLWLFTDRPSLVDIVAGLWSGGEIALAVVVGAFSLVLPGVKLLLLSLAVANVEDTGPPAWIRALAGWSMLDVLVAAVVVFMAKTGTLADAATLAGLWFFVVSVLLTATGAAFLERARRR